MKDLAVQFAEGEMVQADFVSAVEKLSKEKASRSFYLGMAACFFLFATVLVLVILFPGVIAWKY